jgi:tetratricopeptide (TPR) repeat protein
VTGRFAAGVLALALTAAAGRPAQAQDDAPARARELAARAQVHFDLGELDHAIADFREAYRLDPRPGLLYNLGQAYRLDGDFVTAAFMYRSFLRLASADSKHRSVAEHHLATLADCERDQADGGVRPATIEGSTADPDRDLESADPGEDPAPEAREPPAPDDAPAPIVLPAAPAPATLPPPARSWMRRTGAVVAIGGAVTVAAGGYFALDAMRAAAEVSDVYRDGGAWDDIDAVDARGRRSERIGVALLAAGGVIAATGVAIHVVGRRAERRAAVVPVAGGGQLVVAWSF